VSGQPLAFVPGDYKLLGGLPIRILHIQVTAPDLQWLRFEWHPESRNVYYADLRQARPVGEIVAYHVDTHGAAHNAVNVFLRGFRLAQKEAARGQRAEQAAIA